MDDDGENHLELLAVVLVDLRATADAMKRSITNAQSSVEQYRHTHQPELLGDIADCLDHLKREGGGLADGLIEAIKPLQQLRARS